MPFPPTSPLLARALTERAYADPTEVQTAVLAPDAVGRDLLVSAQTGSGKTVAFGLAMATSFLEDTQPLARAPNPLALIVAPTRELALQVQRELAWLYEHTGARIVACVGGMDPRAERRELNFGCHIVVGTPGRLRDHLERGSLRVNDLKAVVLDEADEMLDLGFREDLTFILEATPKERRTFLFSATIPPDIANLAKRYQNDALRIKASGNTRAHADIEYRAMRIAPQDGVHAVVNIVRFMDSPATLVFCNTRDAVRHLHAALVERGFSAVSLSGEFSQEERNHALQALRDGRARICVATDVAARGIDLPNLNLVIHADLPNDAETLQHRSGRTGRAGRKGVSILLVTPTHHRRGERLLGQANIKASWVNPPTPDAIRKIDNERLLQSVLTAETGDAEDLALGQQLLTQRSPSDIAAALVRMYRAQLPAPEDMMETGMPGPREPNSGLAEAVWFRLDVGRMRKADPKWLIPEICRQGGITKREIGAIRILDDETRFEIDASAAEKFAARVAKLSKGDISIEPSDAPPGGGHVRRPPRDFGGKKDWKPKHKRAHGEQDSAPAADKPHWAGKSKSHDKAHSEQDRAPSGDKPHWAGKSKPYDKPRGERDSAPAGDKPRWAGKPKSYDKPHGDRDRAPAGDKPRWAGKPKSHDKPKGEQDRAPSGDKPRWAGKPHAPGKSHGKPYDKPHGKPFNSKPDGFRKKMKKKKLDG